MMFKIEKETLEYRDYEEDCDALEVRVYHDTVVLVSQDSYGDGKFTTHIILSKNQARKLIEALSGRLN